MRNASRRTKNRILKQNKFIKRHDENKTKKSEDVVNNVATLKLEMRMDETKETEISVTDSKNDVAMDLTQQNSHSLDLSKDVPNIFELFPKTTQLFRTIKKNLFIESL